MKLFTRHLPVFFVVGLSVLSFSNAVCQQKFPVTGNISLVPPYSPYINDYVSPGSTTLKFNFVFNDFREPNWQVRFRLRIESIDLKLETRPEFRPPPFTVTPGVSIPLSGEDLAAYFDFKNLTIVGGSSAIFQQNGRLPEGSYTFCIDVVDYPSGIVISNLSCATAWIRLNDPPRVVTPQCDAWVDPFVPLNILFQWQLFNATSPNATQGTEYRLVVYELTDPYANPFTAIANGKVLQIFESDVLTQTSFIYNLSSPPLDIGKTYVYQVRATEVSGRDLFKNNGLSEVCWFHYGYPENGKINTTAPTTDKLYAKSEQPYFKWLAPDLRVRNQPFVYELRIAPINEGQTKEQAIETNTAWYTERTTENNYTSGMDLLLRKVLKAGLSYAWQITAFSGKQTVAKSDVMQFSGPPLIDQFYAGNHLVKVVKANNKDSLSFSGMAKFRVGPKDSLEVPFEKLKLKRIGTYWVLEEGELINELANAQPIILEPRKKENGNAIFYPRTVKLNRQELAQEGIVQWNLPHATKGGQQAQVVSERTWLNFDRFKLLGAAKFNTKNQFELLDPLDFTLQLSPESDFLISENKFELRALGTIQVPEKVKGKQKGKINIPFPKTGQLFYLDSLSVGSTDFAPLENTRIYLHPTKVCIDLSDSKSPSEKSTDLFWKGVLMYEFEVQYNSFFDKYSQLKFKNDIVHTFSSQVTNSPWVDATGLNFVLHQSFNKDTVQFNSFLSRLNQVDLKIEKNAVSNSAFSGEILLPVFSVTDFFPFTIPATTEGLQTGYLENFDDKKFTFNKDGGEQEMFVTIKRGAFEEQRLLNLTLEIDWPSLNIPAQTINNFKIWNDYRIGFNVPNGTVALDNQVQGLLNGYTVTLDAIAAGSNTGLYSFVASAKAQIGDDVAGQKGPPSINVFSIVKNTLAPAGPAYIPGQPVQVTQGEIDAIQQDFKSTSSTLGTTVDASSQERKDLAKETLLNLTSRESKQVTTVEDATKNFAASSATTDLTASSKSGGLLAQLNAEQREIAKEIIADLAVMLTKPLTDSIGKKADKINLRIQSEIDEIIAVSQKQVEQKVNSLVFSIAQRIIQATKNPKVDLSSQIEQLADVVVISVTKEVNASLKASINKNIATPIKGLVRVQIANRITKFIQETTAQLVVKILEGELSLDDVPAAILEDTGDLLASIANAVFEQINFSSLSSMVEATANDALKGIDTDKIVREIGAGAKTIAANVLADEASKIVGKAVAELASSQIGIDVPINFAALSKRIVNGEKIFSLDSVNIRMNTSVIELNAYVYYKRDQPTYGNVWMGNIDVTVKYPKSFSLNLIYLNGRTSAGLHYWFAQISPADGKVAKLGEVMPKKARELKNPVNLGVADLVAVSGRVYRHMKDGEAKPIVPDATNDYGAYLNVVFFDGKGGKSMRLDLAGEYVMSVDKNYVITFDGNVQLMNEAPKALEIDKTAAVKGIVRIMYNSAEQHFLGYGKVEILKPGALCAKGLVLVDTKPGKWRVEVGSREDRIVFQPACAGWAPTGWFAITQSEAELGLGLEYSIKAKTPTILLLLYQVNASVDAGIAAGIMVAVRYNPDFALLRAGLWVDLWASVDVNYKSVLPFSKWKKINILDIYARGNLIMVFQPSPTTLEGSLKGYVKLLGFISLDFDAGFKATL
jgi:hypothetical protein